MKLGYKLAQHLFLVKKVKVNGYKVSVSMDGVEWGSENDLRLDSYMSPCGELGEMEMMYSKEGRGIIDVDSINMAKKIVSILKENKHNGPVIFTVNDHFDGIESVSFE